MNATILKIILKLYGGKQQLTRFELSALQYYTMNASEQEAHYMSKLTDIFFAN